MAAPPTIRADDFARSQAAAWRAGKRWGWCLCVMLLMTLPSERAEAGEVLPRVTVSSSDSIADESGNTGRYTFSRSGATAAELSVMFRVSGTASIGSDFTLTGAPGTVWYSGGLDGSVIIPAGQSSVTVTLTALAETPVGGGQAAEGAETLRLTIEHFGFLYEVGTPNNATVTIASNGFVVANTNDSGSGSLRQAVLNANEFFGANTVTFGGEVFTDATVPDVISLTTGQLSLDSSITIQGPGAKVLTVRRDPSVAASTTSRVFHVNTGATNVVLRDMSISGGNPSTNGGGGILVNGSANVTVNRCAITDNIGAGRGAGIRVMSSGTATIHNSTISNNQVTGTSNCGGGIDNAGTLTVVQSTVSGNSVAGSTTNGGGIFTTLGSAALHNCTIVENQVAGVDGAGGIMVSSGLLTMRSCIVAKNSSPGTSSDIRVTGAISGESFNLVSNSTGSLLFVGNPNSNQSYVGTGFFDPLLGPLADNGGQTKTHKLLAGSLAINKGANLQSLSVDQRGTGFDRTVGPQTDIGAFEAALLVPTVTNATTNEDVQTAGSLVITKNPLDGGRTTHYKITNVQNGAVFLNDGTGPVAAGNFITLAQGAAGLRFTPAANFFGQASFDVQASLNNTNAGLRDDVVTAVITVNPVLDRPSVTSASTLPGQQTVSGLVVTPNPVDGDTATHFKVTSLQHGVLYQNDGTSPINAGAFISRDQGLAGLRYTPLPGFQGVGSFLVQASTSATNAGLGGPLATAQILVGTANPTPSVTTSEVFTAQTGMFELEVEVTNTTALPLNGFRVSVTNLPFSLRLYNATSPPSALPNVYADHVYPVALRQKVTLTLVFYSPTRRWPAGYVPAISVTALQAVSVPTVTGTGGQVTRLIPQADGSVLLEWSSVVGKSYRVKFSNNGMASWLASQVPIKATSTRTQWIDQGPPLTDSHPSTVPSRFYKVEVIPAP